MYEIETTPFLKAAAKKSDPEGLIPLPIKVSVLYINAHTLDEEGIYRVSASVSKLNAIKAEFESENKDKYQYPPFSGSSAAGVLVNYIGSLPESLFTTALTHEFITAAEKSGTDTIHKLLLKLPRANLHTLKFLCEHLKLVAQHSEKNKMNIPNLTRCFGPDYNKILQVLISDTSVFPAN